MRTESTDAIAEVVKVRETAERLANGDSTDGADQVRVLAGLVFQLAEQVQRLEQARGGGTSQD